MIIKNTVEATKANQNPKNLIRSQYKDIMVKVDEDIYYLDRLQLALESEYFEKLFTEDYADKNCELINIPVMDTDTFSDIIDIIYGKKFESVINSNNYVSLLMAMDYLQMEIHPETYKSLVKTLLHSRSPLNVDVFRLYHFVTGNTNYKCVLPVIFEHLSRNLRAVKDLEDFLPIPLDHFSRIISVRDHEPKIERSLCCRICAKWICHDLENRLPHWIYLVNAIKFRLELPFDFDIEILNKPLLPSNKHLNQDTISSIFNKLLEYNGEICCSAKIGTQGRKSPWKNDESDSKNELQFDDDNQFDSVSENQLVSTSTHQSKLKKFLKDEKLCDIVVRTGGKKYKLHRSVLKKASGYFEEIFSAERTELLANSEGIPVLPRDKEYFLNEIDQTTFDIVIDHIYGEKVEFSVDIIVRLFKAAHKLRIDDLLKQCESLLMSNSENLCVQDKIEMLNFTNENVEYKNLNRLYLTKFIVDSWPEVANLAQFADLFKAITIHEEIPGHMEENKVSWFNIIDRGTFQLVINYLYDGKLDLTKDNVVRILKGSEIFKIKELMEESADWLIRRRQPNKELNSEDVLEVLRFGLRNTIYEDLIMIYSTKYMNQWPEIDSSLLCSFSYDALENMLVSSDLYFDDPYKILDICSKWIFHDAENRYHLVPRIALAISRNGFVDGNDFTMESPPDLVNCSQDFIKSKLLELLFTTCVIPSAASLKQEKKFKTEKAIFIASKKDGTFSILNSCLNEIASLQICKHVQKLSNVIHPTPYAMSATIINDNLFLICSIGINSIFLVYNFSLKNTFSLALDSQFVTSKDDSISSARTLKKYTLLNCHNSIYCCVEDGKVLKYSFELNRWKLFSESEPDKNGFWFTSDGNILYRMYKILQTEDTADYVIEGYNIEQNSWITLSNVPVLRRPCNILKQSEEHETVFQLTFLNGFGLGVLFNGILYYLKNQDAEWRWDVFSIPYDCSNRKRFSIPYDGTNIITQDESGEMLYLLNNTLHRFFRSFQEWQLKKELSVVHCNKVVLPYGNFIAIHKPIIHTKLLFQF